LVNELSFNHFLRYFSFIYYFSENIAVGIALSAVGASLGSLAIINFTLIPPSSLKISSPKN
jgi:hypothetical protein